jgi:hypothetical protein
VRRLETKVPKLDVCVPSDLSTEEFQRAIILLRKEQEAGGKAARMCASNT